MKNQSHFSFVIFMFFLLFVGSCFGAIRFWYLGDLSLSSKLMESGFLAAAITVIGGLVGKSISVFFAPSFGAGNNAGLNKEIQSFRPEDLALLENEVPEIDRPEVSGIMGRPPDEMAQMLRKMSAGE